MKLWKSSAESQMSTTFILPSRFTPVCAIKPGGRSAPFFSFTLSYSSRLASNYIVINTATPVSFSGGGCRSSDAVGVVQFGELRVRHGRSIVAKRLGPRRADARLGEGPECLRRLPDVEDAKRVPVHPGGVGDQPVGRIPLRVKRPVHCVVLISRETLEIQLHEYGHIFFSLSRGIGWARFRPSADRGSRGSLAPAPAAHPDPPRRSPGSACSGRSSEMPRRTPRRRRASTCLRPDHSRCAESAPPAPRRRSSRSPSRSSRAWPRTPGSRLRPS